jgi:hypothetical protein
VASFLFFVPRTGAVTTIDGLRQAFVFAGLPCVAETADDARRALLDFAPTSNLLYLTLKEGLVRRADLSPDYRPGHKLGDRIITVLDEMGFDYCDENEIESTDAE